MDISAVLSTTLSWVSAHPVWSSVLGLIALGLVVNCVEFAGVLVGYGLVVVAAFLFAGIKGNWLYFWVFLLGMATALTEIIGKFRDEPLKSFRTREALVYHVFNGLASMFALYVLILYGWPIDTPLDRMKAVVTAGLGAMLFMRSRLFNVKLEKEDVSFGPEQFVKVFLRFMEQAIGRVRAQARIDFVNDVMNNVKASAVADYVITMLGAVQLLEGRDGLVESVKKTCAGSESEQNKAYKLGYLLLDQGEDFVRKLFHNKNEHPDWLISAPGPSPQPEGLVARAKASFGIEKPEEPVAYFAYGENLSSARLCERLNWTTEQARKAWEQTKPPVKATLRGYELVFGKARTDDTGVNGEVRATIVPTADDAAKVEGVVYWLPPAAMKFLDAPYARGYQRVTIRVLVPGQGGKTDAIDSHAYRSDIAEKLPPSREYVRLMVTGAEEHGLPREYVEMLKKYESGGGPVTP